MSRLTLGHNETMQLLEGFNRRDEAALSRIYELFYQELRFFADRFFTGPGPSARDVVQDVFISLWERRRVRFDSLGNIKGYLYVSIKNRFRDQLDHRRHVDDHARRAMRDADIVTQIAEPEIYSILSWATDILPQECARVFRLHLEGWEIADIAQRLDKSESTVYKQRQQAIETIKKRLPKSLMELLLTFF